MNHHGYNAEFEELCKSTKDRNLKITQEIQELLGVNDTATATDTAELTI